MTRTYGLRLLPALLALLFAACNAASDSREPGNATAKEKQSAAPLITVQAIDYAYSGLADTVTSGPVRIVLRNAGRFRHELALARLKPGVTLEQALAVARTGGDGDQVLDQELGVIVAAPGATSTDTLRVELQPGRTYAVVCFLRDAPGQPEHIAMGMAKGFVAR